MIWPKCELFFDGTPFCLVSGSCIIVARLYCITLIAIWRVLLGILTHPGHLMSLPAFCWCSYYLCFFWYACFPHLQFYVLYLILAPLHCVCRSFLFPVFTFWSSVWNFMYLNCPIVHLLLFLRICGYLFPYNRKQLWETIIDVKTKLIIKTETRHGEE